MWQSVKQAHVGSYANCGCGRCGGHWAQKNPDEGTRRVNASRPSSDPLPPCLHPGTRIRVPPGCAAVACRRSAAAGFRRRSRAPRALPSRATHADGLPPCPISARKKSGPSYGTALLFSCPALLCASRGRTAAAPYIALAPEAPFRSWLKPA